MPPKTGLAQTTSHMASVTQDEEPRRNLKQGRILQWQHSYPNLLLIRSFAREEGKRKRRTLQWQHRHPPLAAHF